jgi:hypothetical protein
LFWKVQYLEDERQVGENNHGDDWKYFEEAQDSVFKDWYNRTAPPLVDAIIKEYVK